jgi:hypothetical protein
MQVILGAFFFMPGVFILSVSLFIRIHSGQTGIARVRGSGALGAEELMMEMTAGGDKGFTLFP